MLVYGWFSVGLTEGSPELVQALLKIHPSGRRFTHPIEPDRLGERPTREFFECELPEGDPTLDRLMQVIKDHGYRLWAGRGESTPLDIIFEYRRKYETSDFETSALLIPLPKKYVGSGGNKRNEHGLMLLNPELDRNELISFANTVAIGHVSPDKLIVSTELKELMEQSGLLQLCFKPVLNKHCPDLGPIPKFWELTSDCILPSLANPELFDGFYKPVEFHYRGSDLKAVAPFDFARCLEYRDPVVTKRFYQFCVNQKLDMAWTPVRIDPD
jgi:hypothetical protein